MDSDVSDKERVIALNYCIKFLTGAWTNISVDQVNVTALSGGLTNMLYRCALIDEVELSGDEPRQVLLRIYGPARTDLELQIIIFNQLAQAGLGPSLHCAFEGGQFEQYLPSSALTWTQMTDDSISRVIAQKIAAIQKLQISELEKSPNWVIDKLEEFAMGIKLNGGGLTFDQDTLESTKKIAHQMMTIDFKLEIDNLVELIKSSTMPLVFSHNDLHQNNIILLHDTSLCLYDRVVLIDFEYSSYNHLTFDLANHLSEWCFDYNTTEGYPGFNFSLDRFPSQMKQRQFVQCYLSALDPTLRNRFFNDSSLSESDLVELLLDEMQPFLMASNLLWAIWSVRSAFESKIKFGYWEMAKSKWDVYALCKKQYQARGAPDGNHSIKLQRSRM